MLVYPCNWWVYLYQSRVCCRQALSLMFEELSDLSDADACGSSLSDRHSDDNDDLDLYSKQNVLKSKNYSWTARNGMKVVMDTELKRGRTIPSPSMYSKRPYCVEGEGAVVVSTLESANTNQFYQSFFKTRVKSEKTDDSEDLLLKGCDDTAAVHSPAPTSHTSGATDCSAQTEKRLAPDSGLSHFPVCTCDIKMEACEHNSSDGYGVVLTGGSNCSSNSKSRGATQPTTSIIAATAEDSSSSAVADSSVKEGDVKTELVDEALQALEAKLKSSRKRRSAVLLSV